MRQRLSYDLVPSRWLAVVVLLCLFQWPLERPFEMGQAVWAQSRIVQPHELELTVEVDPVDHDRMTREMVLITIRGTYRRHITLETLQQPELEGFSWTQLGDDLWQEERIDGQKVKTFRRRMALFPDQPGQLTIGAFRHNLTLTDEGDDWFEHQISSEPITIDVVPAPETEDWWFPVKSLRVQDQWSNAPDQLKPGEGVLRIIRVEALGVTPEMLPPMPELTSPSAMIFPHPEKRLVDLSPEGPLSYAFWRWTIQPTNDVSAITEPIRFTYFDTVNRVTREVEISAQRVAYGDVAPDAAGAAARQSAFPAPGSLPGWPVVGLAFGTFVLGIWFAVKGRNLDQRALWAHVPLLDPQMRTLKAAARARDLKAMRRAASAILARDEVSDQASDRASDQAPDDAKLATHPQNQFLAQLDAMIYGKASEAEDLMPMVLVFLGQRKSSGAHLWTNR